MAILLRKVGVFRKSIPVLSKIGPFIKRYKWPIKNPATIFKKLCPRSTLNPK